jgi:hypothetical protein
VEGLVPEVDVELRFAAHASHCPRCEDPFRVYVNGDTSVSVAMPMPEMLRNTSTPKPAKPAKPTQLSTAMQLMSAYKSRFPHAVRPFEAC